MLQELLFCRTADQEICKADRISVSPEKLKTQISLIRTCMLLCVLAAEKGDCSSLIIHEHLYKVSIQLNPSSPPQVRTQTIK